MVQNEECSVLHFICYHFNHMTVLRGFPFCTAEVKLVWYRRSLEHCLIPFHVDPVPALDLPYPFQMPFLRYITLQFYCWMLASFSFQKQYDFCYSIAGLLWFVQYGMFQFIKKVTPVLSAVNTAVRISICYFQVHVMVVPQCKYQTLHIQCPALHVKVVEQV